MNMTDIRHIIERINELFEEEYFKDYEEKYNLNPSKYEKEEFIVEMFTRGGCAIYGEFLYDIFKDYGASLVISKDHVLMKMGYLFYDVTGLNLDPTYDGFDEFNLENQKDVEDFEYYKDVVCQLYFDARKKKYEKCIKVLNTIRDQIKEEVITINGEKVKKLEK